MSVAHGKGVLRARDGHEARVTNAELFFDLAKKNDVAIMTGLMKICKRNIWR